MNICFIDFHGDPTDENEGSAQKVMKTFAIELAKNHDVNLTYIGVNRERERDLHV